MSLRLGVHVGQQNMTMDAMRQLWRKLDEKVYWISAWDHFYEAPPAGGTIAHFEAMATLGPLATETKNAAIGVMVLYVGYRNPASIAKAAATLEVVAPCLRGRPRRSCFICTDSGLRIGSLQLGCGRCVCGSGLLYLGKSKFFCWILRADLADCCLDNL